MPPSAAGRMTVISAQPYKNAGHGPKPSRMYAKMPPERGSALASSAMVRAPHKEIIPPRTQASNATMGSCVCAATIAGTRKMPLPMVVPIRIATELQTPRRLGSRSPQGSIWSRIIEAARAPTSACRVPRLVRADSLHIAVAELRLTRAQSDGPSRDPHAFGDRRDLQRITIPENEISRLTDGYAPARCTLAEELGRRLGDG